jgi:hypothetical protein
VYENITVRSTFVTFRENMGKKKIKKEHATPSGSNIMVDLVFL